MAFYFVSKYLIFPKYFIILLAHVDPQANNSSFLMSFPVVFMRQQPKLALASLLRKPWNPENCVERRTRGCFSMELVPFPAGGRCGLFFLFFYVHGMLRLEEGYVITVGLSLTRPCRLIPETRPAARPRPQIPAQVLPGSYLMKTGCRHCDCVAHGCPTCVFVLFFCFCFF